MNAALRAEGGVTDISLHNARLLLETHDLPDSIALYQRLPYTEGAEHLVEARWSDGTTHVFSGFAWGYTGTGPQGLEIFLDMLHCCPRVNLRTIASWPQERFPSLTLIRGEDYGLPAPSAAPPDRDGPAPDAESAQDA